MVDFKALRVPGFFFGGEDNRRLGRQVDSDSHACRWTVYMMGANGLTLAEPAPSTVSRSSQIIRGTLAVSARPVLCPLFVE